MRNIDIFRVNPAVYRAFGIDHKGEDSACGPLVGEPIRSGLGTAGMRGCVGGFLRVFQALTKYSLNDFYVINDSICGIIQQHDKCTFVSFSRMPNFGDSKYASSTRQHAIGWLGAAVGPMSWHIFQMNLPIYFGLNKSDINIIQGLI